LSIDKHCVHDSIVNTESHPEILITDYLEPCILVKDLLSWISERDSACAEYLSEGLREVLESLEENE